MSEPQNHPDPKLPAALARDLTALYRPATSIPPDLDAEIRLAAQAKFDSAHRPMVITRLRRLGAGMAVAASLAIVAYLAWPSTRPTQPAGTPISDLAIARSKSEAPALEQDAKKDSSRYGGLASGKPMSAASLNAASRGDVNADGRIDILDALALATALRDGTVEANLQAVADINGDGRLDQQDIDAIARSAVSLASSSGKGGGG